MIAKHLEGDEALLTRWKFEVWWLRVKANFTEIELKLKSWQQLSTKFSEIPHFFVNFLASNSVAQQFSPLLIFFFGAYSKKVGKAGLGVVLRKRNSFQMEEWDVMNCVVQSQGQKLIKDLKIGKFC